MNRLKASATSTVSESAPSPSTDTDRWSTLRPPAGSHSAGRGYADPLDWDS